MADNLLDGRLVSLQPRDRRVPFAPRADPTGLQDVDHVDVGIEYGLELIHVTDDHVGGVHLLARSAVVREPP